MNAHQRTALVSVVAAAGLVAIKLVTGLLTGSLGLIAEAIHSGTDLVAALLTFLAVGVAGRPPDVTHQFGHGKAEHLAALAEGAFLLAASAFIALRSIERLTAGSPPEVDAHWWALAVMGVVVVVDCTRATISWRAARRLRSPALASNALHFGSDLLGTSAVLAGLVLVRWGYPWADSIAALLVAVLVVAAAGRLMIRNVEVLMDRAPDAARARAQEAIERLRQPGVELRRLRMREAAGRQFADVVVGVRPDAAVGQGHAVADAVERAVEEALPGSDVVVHVEPNEAAGALRERASAAALTVPGVREVHNVSVLEVSGRPELSLHLKLPAGLTLVQAHAITSQVEAAIRHDIPQVARIDTHMEPLAEPASGVAASGPRVQETEQVVRDVVEDLAACQPSRLRFRATERGLIVFLTLELPAERALGDAHALASLIEERIRARRAEIADVVIHTEPRGSEGVPA